MRERMQASHGLLVWFDADDFPDRGQDEVDRLFYLEVGRRYSGRDRDSLERWVQAAASWKRVADLLDERVGAAVHAGWTFFQDEGPPRKPARSAEASLDMLARLIRDSEPTPHRPAFSPSRRAASAHTARAASAHGSARAASAQTPRAASAPLSSRQAASARPASRPAAHQAPRV